MNSKINVVTPCFKTSLLAAAIAAVSAPNLAFANGDDAPIMFDVITIEAVRDDRVSNGATGLELSIKETPQSISVATTETLDEQGVTSTNEALDMLTGIDVQQYETNRASYVSRGFEIQHLQVDGAGTQNAWGTVVGEMDTALFEKVELIRGANGLLTGVGNSSGTINYVRKRPTNEDEGSITLNAGSYDQIRGVVDYNKVLTEDGRVAARVVLANESTDSHIRDLHTDRTTAYVTVDAQVGENGVLTGGVSHTTQEQDSPMWGSLTLNYLSGGYADFDTSASTSADWTYWDTETTSAFVDYLHMFSDTLEGKVSVNATQFTGDSQLLYAYNPSGTGLNDDNTGLTGWPYAGHTERDWVIVDAQLNGEYELLGRSHRFIAGISHSHEKTATSNRPVTSGGFLALGDFSTYDGSSYAEPVFGASTARTTGQTDITRLYGATQYAITDALDFFGGVNAIKLSRTGASIYGNAPSTGSWPDMGEVTPYYGFTYDFNDDTTAYASYSSIFQVQDNQDINGLYVDPMQGVNYELGIKSEFFDDQLLASAAVFKAEQLGLATFAGTLGDGSYYYEGKDTYSEGVEVEVNGAVSENTHAFVGASHVTVTGVDGERTMKYSPQTMVKLGATTELQTLPVKLGFTTQWRSDVVGDGAKQDAFAVTDVFAKYQVSEDMDVQLNIDNVFNKKYVEVSSFGGIYGAPISAMVSLNVSF